MTLYILLGFGCAGAAFVLFLNRKFLPAVAFAFLAGCLLISGITNQP